MFSYNLFLRQKKAQVLIAIGSGVGNYRSCIIAAAVISRNRTTCLGIRRCNMARARSIGSRRFTNFGRGSESNLGFSN